MALEMPTALEAARCCTLATHSHTCSWASCVGGDEDNVAAVVAAGTWCMRGRE